MARKASPSVGDFVKIISELHEEAKAGLDVEKVPTGSVVVDAICGGGFPRGTFIEWSSDSGLGKTTAMLFICRTYADRGEQVIYLDHEQAVNQNQLDGIGCTPYLHSENNTEGKIHIFQPITFTDAERILDKVMPFKPGLVVIDSVTTMEVDGEREPGKSLPVGVHARRTGEFLRRYKAKARLSGTTFVFINQVRTKIRMMGPSTVEPAGGYANKFSADIRLLMDGQQKLKKSEETLAGTVEVPYGTKVNLYALKNRFARPAVKIPMYIIFGRGVSNVQTYMDYLENEGVLSGGGKGGNYVLTMAALKEPIKLRGSLQVQAWIRDNLEMVKEFVDQTGGFRLVYGENPAEEDASVAEDSYAAQVTEAFDSEDEVSLEYD